MSAFGRSRKDVVSRSCGFVRHGCPSPAAALQSSDRSPNPASIGVAAMRSRLLVLCLVIAVPQLAAAQQYPHVAPTDPLTPDEERKTFKLPPGFEAQLVASEP